MPAFFIGTMDIVQKISQTIEPSLDAMGYSIVLLKLAEGSRRKALILMAERKDEQAMGFDDCTEISRTVSALLDVEDPITGAYDLEVMSPGIDRPLTREADFKRFAGHEAKMESILPIEGRKRFKGTIKGIKDGMVTLDMPEGTVEIPFQHIRTAKLTVPAPESGPGIKPGKKKK